ncbi:MAG: C4-dicarboxylate ABC transporter permease, partial [Rhizobiales bacterium]|nr:C4-dicarboxylate ABC transporter permease [Hyphomicrobiales bacterium]
LHHQVRKAQFEVRELEDLVKNLETDLRRTGDRPEHDAKRQRIKNKITAAKAEMAELTATIPADWEEKHKAFSEVQTAYNKARRIYRSHADGAFEPILEINKMLAGSDALEALREPIAGLKPLLESGKPEDFIARVAEVSRMVRKVEGTSRIRSQLSRARKAIRSKKPSPEKAVKALDKAMQLFEEDTAWRSRAARELLPGMDAYNAGIRNTIGLRQLSRLPEEQSLYAARCNSGHRDISLNF